MCLCRGVLAGPECGASSFWLRGCKVSEQEVCLVVGGGGGSGKGKRGWAGKVMVLWGVAPGRCWKGCECWSEVCGRGGCSWVGSTGVLRRSRSEGGSKGGIVRPLSKHWRDSQGGVGLRG